MPQPALTVFLIIAAIAIVVVLIAVIVIALRAQRRRKLAQRLPFNKTYTEQSV